VFSQAGPIAMLVAATHPERTRALVLYATYAMNGRAIDTWRVDDQDEADEFEFEDEFEDSESLKDRVRRGPILGVLLGTTLFAGAVWVVLNSINHIRQANLIRQASVYPDIFSSESENELWVWMQAASGIAYTVFLVALGSYVVLWLALREESS
jgi:pimeloyl-ACP methyl ester carboxylesterase